MQKKDWLRIFLFFAWYTNFIVHWLFPMFFVETGIIILSLKNPKNILLDSRETVASTSPDGIQGQGQVHPYHNEKKNASTSLTKAVRCMQFLNGFVAIAFLAFLGFLYISTEGRWWGAIMISLGLGEGLFLILAVLFMRSMINTTGQRLVNECLILIHLGNFIIWGILFVLQNIWAIRIEKGYDDMSYY